MIRRHVSFACEGDTLVGTLDGPAEGAAASTGLLLVTGGNETRAGAFSGQARLAVRLAAAGYPVWRFDRRGVGDGFVGAEIPYVGGDFSMLVIVPDEGIFEDVRQWLDQDLLDEIDATFTTGPYELLIPKWETTTQLDLIEWLTDQGAAPGSYPSISPDAFLGEAVHGADIAVDERGTVAAAATALSFEESGPPESELTVKADRPFLYLIRHRPTGLVLFAGQVTDPT